MTFGRIGMLGTGAWGSALANIAARAGREVTFWGRDPAAVAAIAATRENPRLPGIRLDPRVTVTADLAAVAAADAVLLVVPAQALREVAAALAPVLRPDIPVVA